MTHNMPLRDIVPDSNRVDAVRHSSQIVSAVGLARRLTQSGKIYRKTSEAPAQSFNDALPQETTGRNPMNKKYGTAGTAANQMHIQDLGIGIRVN